VELTKTTQVVDGSRYDVGKMKGGVWSNEVWWVRKSYISLGELGDGRGKVGGELPR